MIIQGPEVAAWIYEKTKGCITPHTTTIGWYTDKLLAGVAYEGWNGPNVYVHQRIDHPPPRSFWYAVADYPFNRLGCKRLTGPVSSANLAARRLNEHIGFKLEATLKDATEDGDMLIYVLWKEDCRFLNWGKYGK